MTTEWRKGFIYYYYSTNSIGFVEEVDNDDNEIIDTWGNCLGFDEIKPATNKQALELLKNLDEKIASINVKRHLLKEWVLYPDD